METPIFPMILRFRRAIDLDVEGLSIHVSHGHELGSPDTRAVSSRRTRPTSSSTATRTSRSIERSGDRLVVNPGAAGPRRFNLQPSVATADHSSGARRMRKLSGCKMQETFVSSATSLEGRRLDLASGAGENQPIGEQEIRQGERRQRGRRAERRLNP